MAASGPALGFAAAWAPVAQKTINGPGFGLVDGLGLRFRAEGLGCRAGMEMVGVYGRVCFGTGSAGVSTRQLRFSDSLYPQSYPPRFKRQR